MFVLIWSVNSFTGLQEVLLVVSDDRVFESRVDVSGIFGRDLSRILDVDVSEEKPAAVGSDPGLTNGFTVQVPAQVGDVAQSGKEQLQWVT